MRRLMIQALILLLTFTSPSLAEGRRSAPLPASKYKKHQFCRHTADCVRVDNGCCDCANGGDTIAIHRKFEAKFRAQFKCDGIACPQKAGDCGFREPECKDNVCVLGPQKKWQNKK